MLNLFSKDNINFEEEMKWLKKSKKITETEFQDLKDKYTDTQEELLNLLREKGEKFDRYLEYHDLCLEYEAQVKENKKEISDLKSELKVANEEIKTLTAKNIEIEDSLSKLRKKYNIKEPKSELEIELEKVINKEEN